MDVDEKFRNLLIMAAADGRLTEREINLLSDRSARWKISDADRDAAIELVLAEQPQLRIPSEKSDRVEMIRDLMRMMAADGELADLEKQLFATAAAKMGVSEHELNKIIDSII